MEIWYYFFGNCDGMDEDKKIVKFLKEAGLELLHPDSEKPSGPGIIFFKNVDTDLQYFVKKVSRKSTERILAISGSPVNNIDIWNLLQAGASDVIVLDESLDWVMIKERLDRWDSVSEILESPLVKDNLVGQSPAWKFALREIIEIAHFTSASVLIMGESGTGKELVARLIHTLDTRQNKGKLVILDCTTIVPELSGSEFFGHERGAFTGAASEREGAFALADKGTLFLDEVGDLPFNLQSQLLRVIQEHTYKRVGGNTWQNTDFRLVCATNKNLQKEVESGNFRRDLYYRIADWNCELPSLRMRPEDIILLAQHFIKKLWNGNNSPKLDKYFCQYLLRRNYPGNVRDLKQLISRISYFHVGSGPLTIGDIPKEERSLMDLGSTKWMDENMECSINRALLLGVQLKDIRHELEETAIEIAIEKEGSLKHAAIKLGVSERTLQMRKAATNLQTKGTA